MGERNFSRVDFSIEAAIRSRSGVFSGAVENLSLNGLFVKTAEQLPPDEEVEIDITLPGTSPDMVLTLNGVVARITDEGIAFKFQKIDLDTFTHLKNIVSYKSGNADMVMDELMNYINKKMTSRKPE